MKSQRISGAVRHSCALAQGSRSNFARLAGEQSCSASVAQKRNIAQSATANAVELAGSKVQIQPFLQSVGIPIWVFRIFLFCGEERIVRLCVEASFGRGGTAHKDVIFLPRYQFFIYLS